MKTEGCIALTIESPGEPLSTVRFERTETAADRFSIRLEDGAVVVACGRDAVLEAEGPAFAGAPHAARLLLRDGRLAVRIASIPTSANGDDAEARWDSEPRRRLPPAMPGPPFADIGDAEWQAVTPTETTRVATAIEIELPRAERARASGLPLRPTRPTRPARAHADAGDAPTRIDRLDDVLGGPVVLPRSSAPPKSASPWRNAFAPASQVGAGEGKGPRLRPGVRRFALLAMLAAAWMLWFHAYRGRHAGLSRGASHGAKALSAGAPAAPVASVASAPAVSVASATSSFTVASANGSALQAPPSGANPTTRTSPGVPAGAAPAAPLDPATSALPTPSSSSAAVSEARLAADALTNGAYADALKLYDDLASKAGSNPAYAEIARNLRARTSQRSP